jgi:hypothetical protein
MTHAKAQRTQRENQFLQKPKKVNYCHTRDFLFLILGALCAFA